MSCPVGVSAACRSVTVVVILTAPGILRHGRQGRVTSRLTEQAVSAVGDTGPVCGRYALKASDDELSGLYGAFVVGEESRPSWNVAPAQEVRVVLEHLPSSDPDPVLERQIRSVRWGC